nr:MAG TPA: hypothetical protein [Caudoviricetes sp.]
MRKGSQNKLYRSVDSPSTQYVANSDSGVSSPILLNHTTRNTKVVILVSLPRLESSL